MKIRMGSAKSEGTKPKHQTSQVFEMSGQKRLLQLYILSSHLAADVAGRAQQKALTRPLAFRMAATAVENRC